MTEDIYQHTVAPGYAVQYTLTDWDSGVAQRLIQRVERMLRKKGIL